MNLKRNETTNIWTRTNLNIVLNFIERFTIVRTFPEAKSFKIYFVTAQFYASLIHIIINFYDSRSVTEFYGT